MEREPSLEQAPTVWTLWNMDIYGNQYRMPIPVNSEDHTRELEEFYTAKGHHQTYTAKELATDDTVTFIPVIEQ